MAKTQEKWSIDTSLAAASAFRQFRKKHPREYDSCFNNLDKIQQLLDDGKSLSEIQYNPSFFRHETKGNIQNWPKRFGRSKRVETIYLSQFFWPTDLCLGNRNKGDAAG
jgi:hypothetical protein